MTVAGQVLTMWARRGFETGSLGWPTEEAQAVTAHCATGLVQRFRNGVVTVQGTPRTVTGASGANYRFHGGPSGALGWPVSASRKSTANGRGWSQRFSGGAIFWSRTTGAHALSSNATLSRYDAGGGVAGPLGWLRTSRREGRGTVAVFTRGRIYSSRAGTATVSGAILSRYLAKVGTSGVLGWPTSNPATTRTGAVQTFQHGRITWSATRGAKAGRT